MVKKMYQSVFFCLGEATTPSLKSSRPVTARFVCCTCDTSDGSQFLVCAQHFCSCVPGFGLICVGFYSRIKWNDDPASLMSCLPVMESFQRKQSSLRLLLRLGTIFAYNL